MIKGFEYFRVKMLTLCDADVYQYDFSVSELILQLLQVFPCFQESIESILCFPSTRASFIDVILFLLEVLD